jgi:tetratricopeptide (TPR) repeat protein
MLTCVEAELGNGTEARGACLGLLQRLPSEAMEPIARASLAAINRTVRSPELREEADASSAFALEKAPNHSWALGTRGTVLVWLGRLDDAIPILEKAYVRASSRRARSGHACDLVAAHAARGDLEHAHKCLERALVNGARGKRLDEAQAAIKGVEERATQPSQTT